MAIPEQKATASGLRVEINYPQTPMFKNAEDRAAFEKWWFDLQQVLQRRDSAIKTAIDKLNAAS